MSPCAVVCFGMCTYLDTACKQIMNMDGQVIADLCNLNICGYLSMRAPVCVSVYVTCVVHVCRPTAKA